MPTYLFQHPETKEVIEVIQRATEDHVYVDENKVQWNRVWTVPNTAVDSQCDGSYDSFMKNTANMKGVTVGDMWDASKEASLKRQAREGKDGVRDKHFKKYSKKRDGMKHKEDGGNLLSGGSGTLEI